VIITTNVAWSAGAVASLQQHGHGGWHASRVPLVNCSSTVESGLSTEPGVYDGVVCRRDQEDDQPTRQIDLPTERHVCRRQWVQQAAQLSQRDRLTFCVVEYFAKSLKFIQSHSKWHPSVGVKQYGRPPIFHCMYRPRAGTTVCYIHYSLNHWHPISGLTRFASNAKRFYRELGQRIITNDDVIKRQPMTGGSSRERELWTRLRLERRVT